MIFVIQKPTKWLLLVPILVLVSSVILLLFPVIYYDNFDKMYMALTIDLAITFPLSYLLVSSKIKLPKALTLPLFIIGLLLSSLLIPNAHQSTFKWLLHYVLPLIELSVLSIISYKVYQLRKAFKAENKNEFYDDLQNVSKQFLPLIVAQILSFEMAVFYYAFTLKKGNELKGYEFSNYKDSGIKAILGALLLAIFAETIGLHFLLMKWSQTAAIIISILSIYTGIQVLAIIRSLKHTPSSINKNELKIRFGILQSAIIPISQIKKINLISDNEAADFKGFKMSFTSQNIEIKTTEIITVSSFYGLKKKVDHFTFFIDQPNEFLNQINKQLNS